MRTQLFLITIFISLIFSATTFGLVNQDWVATYSGPGSNFDEAHSIAVDASGNVYVTGASIGSTTGRDYATVKYNSAGVQLWASRYNGEGGRDDFANSIAIDASGNVYVTGWSNVSATGKDYLTIKYNSSGDSLWVRRYSMLSSSFNDEASSLKVDLSGNVYVTGYAVNGTNSDYATIKYNSTGVQQWVSIYNGPGNATDNASALAIDAIGNVYVTGASFDGTTGLDYATVKYNSAGIQQWVSRYSGMPINLSDVATDIAVDGSGNVYVTGSSPGNGTGNDYATVKYNSSGIQQWASRYNGPTGSADEASSIAVDISGNVFVTGGSLGIGTMYDYATIKYNSSGVENWVRRYNGPGGNVSDIAHAITLDNFGNVYVTGESSGDGGDYFRYATVKYNTNGDSLWVKTYGELLAGHDRAYSIAADASGNIYVTGTSVQAGTGSDYGTIKYSQYSNAVITAFIEGFYNPSLDKMITDSAKVYIRNSLSPFALIDSSISKLDSTGTAKFYFSNVSNGVNYYISFKHRNSIETWSSTVNSFTAGTLSYNFSNASGKAYGNNETQIDNTPLRFAVYGGDVNHDGFVNLADVISINNDQINFVTGYVQTDVTGDNTVNLTDVLLAYNNSAKFVSIVRP